ncbi:MAG: hypothetical protein NTX50_16755, partial [Candidatus Sumerlaeota bacterium]|nr:hypothetical protein [Candidatus Sumerlaeota bacterium]
LYLACEQYDGQFLDEHSLPDGLAWSSKAAPASATATNSEARRAPNPRVLLNIIPRLPNPALTDPLTDDSSRFMA